MKIVVGAIALVLVLAIVTSLVFIVVNTVSHIKNDRINVFAAAAQATRDVIDWWTSLFGKAKAEHRANVEYYPFVNVGIEWNTVRDW